VIRHIAVIDSNVIIDIIDTTNTPASNDRRTRIRLTIEALQTERARFVVPAPVVAELCRGVRGSEVVRDLTRAVFRGARVQPLDTAAADVAGRIASITVPGTSQLERGAVKFDTLVAGIAHHIDAKWLVTSNVRHIRSALNAIGSPVEIVDPTQQFGRQGVIVQYMTAPAIAVPTVQSAAPPPDEPTECRPRAVTRQAPNPGSRLHLRLSSGPAKCHPLMPLRRCEAAVTRCADAPLPRAARRSRAT